MITILFSFINSYHIEINLILYGSWLDQIEIRLHLSSDISSIGKQHFQSLFKENHANNIGEIMKVVRLFLWFIDYDMNDIM